MNSPASARDQIHLEQLKLQACLGVSEAERSRAQPIAISLTLRPANGFDRLEDDVENTVDYASVAAEVRKTVAHRVDKLIETLATAVAETLLANFPLRRVEIELRKFVFPDADYVSVVLTRERAMKS